MFTAAGGAGGLVIICGTGTMAQLIDGEGKAYNCGGWGHMFGDGEKYREETRPDYWLARAYVSDIIVPPFSLIFYPLPHTCNARVFYRLVEASAFHIASTAIRRVFYGLDGYTPDASVPVPDVGVAYAAMLDYFKVRLGVCGLIACVIGED